MLQRKRIPVWGATRFEPRSVVLCWRCPDYSACAWHTLLGQRFRRTKTMETDKRLKPSEELVKIVFNLPGNSGAIATESLWAERLSANLYRLRNVPFYLSGVSEQDVVKAEEKGGRLLVTGIVDRGGHSTYRIFLSERTSEEQFLRDWVPLRELGCTYERATQRLVAIDVPPHADVYAVYETLEIGEREHPWEFQEGHCGHPLRETPARKP